MKICDELELAVKTSVHSSIHTYIRLFRYSQFRLQPKTTHPQCLNKLKEQKKSEERRMEKSGKKDGERDLENIYPEYQSVRALFISYYDFTLLFAVVIHFSPPGTL